MQQGHLYIENEGHKAVTSGIVGNKKEQEIGLYNAIYQFLQDRNIAWYLERQRAQGYNDIATKRFISEGLRKLIRKKLKKPVMIHFKDEQMFNLIVNKYNMYNILLIFSYF